MPEEHHNRLNYTTASGMPIARRRMHFAGEGLKGFGAMKVERDRVRLWDWECRVRTLKLKSMTSCPEQLGNL
jgi:hypothetical protein